MSGIFYIYDNYLLPKGDIRLETNKKIRFRDAAIHIRSDADGHLDITADVSIDLNGNVVLGAKSITVNGVEIVGSDGEVNKAAVEDSTNWDAAYTDKHTQGTDQGLDTGGANEVAVADIVNITNLKEKAITLLSSTTVSFAADADTTLYTVPTGKRCILFPAVVVAGADAGATTTLSIGQNGAETDFIPANTLSNLDAQYDAVILKPIPNTTPLKNKSYAAGTVIEARVASHSGGAVNTLYLFGMLY